MIRVHEAFRWLRRQEMPVAWLLRPLGNGRWQRRWSDDGLWRDHKLGWLDRRPERAQGRGAERQQSQAEQQGRHQA